MTVEENLKVEYYKCHVEYNNSLHKLFQALELKIQHRPTVEPISVLENIIDIDKRLQNIVHKINEHQIIYSRIAKLQEAIEKETVEQIDLVANLNNLEQELSNILKEANRNINHYQNGIPCDQLLSYAQRVASHTLSPMPPIPQDNLIRKSLLFRQNIVEEEDDDMMQVAEIINDEAEVEEAPEEETDEGLLDLDLF